MSIRLSDRTVIVTGGSRGIGLATAESVIEHGGRAVITGRKPEQLAEAVAQLGGPDVALGIAGHAEDADHQDEVITRAQDTFGNVDRLVNCAGINPTFGSLLNLDLGVARKVVEVNCLAALSWVQKLHKVSMQTDGGAVVNVASIGGLRPAPGIAMYGASKAMLIHLTEELAVELAPKVRVNAVAPGTVKTKFASALYEGQEEKAAAPYLLGRLGVPEDVAGAITFLLSDEAAWITGQTLVIDGGVTLLGGAARV